MATNNLTNETSKTHQELVEAVHAEISAMGTSSRYLGRGLDENGVYDAEEIAAAIEAEKN